MVSRQSGEPSAGSPSPGHPVPDDGQDSLTKSEREALKAVYRLTRDGSEAHTGVLAENLGLSPGTVTTLIKRLADRMRRASWKDRQRPEYRQRRYDFHSACILRLVEDAIHTRQQEGSDPMNEDLYTLDQARIKLAHRECRTEGHDLTLDDHRTLGGDHFPLNIRCRRCRRWWVTGPGTGGINLGEHTPNKGLESAT